MRIYICIYIYTLVHALYLPMYEYIIIYYIVGIKVESKKKISTMTNYLIQLVSGEGR